MTLREAIKILSDAGIESAAYDARTLFSTIGKMSPAELVSQNSECNSPALAEAVKRRAAREPLQYIAGEVGFYREAYTVSPACLIPRADTELLVDYAVKHIPSGKCFVDLCTGSGCVVISTLNNTKDTRAIAVDISSEALSVAKKNAKRISVSERLTFIECDVMSEPVTESCFAVLSNPPYVTEAEYRDLMPEIYFEPKIAFVGGEDGLNFYKHITKAYRNVISDDGFIGFEIGCSQGKALIEIAAKNGMSAEILKDYGGNDRVAILKKV